MDFQTVFSPESQGIRSKALIDFLDEIEEKKLEMHSMLIVKNDHLIFKGYYSPFDENKSHRLCSAGKAIVALAVLFMVQEKMIKLEDTAVMHLPKNVYDQADERGRRVTIYDLLTMHAGHDRDSYCDMHESGVMHVTEFFRVPFLYEPGSFFLYDNGIPDVLAAILYEKTGKRVIEYLTPRLFEPLGIREVRVERDSEFDNLPTMCMTTENLLRLTYFFYSDGKIGNDQILDENLVKAAVSYQVPTATYDETKELLRGNVAHTNGYGFQIWGNIFGGFILDGGCGQMGIGVKELGLVIAINANDPMSDRIVQLLWEHLRANMFSRAIAEDESVLMRLREKEASLTRFVFPKSNDKIDFSGMYKNDSEDTILDIKELSISVKGSGVVLEINGNKEKTLNIMLDGKINKCRIPFLFTEMRDEKEHRKFEHGLRLDTHVGYNTKEGYVAGICNGDTVILEFCSDAWMGTHILWIKKDINNETLIISQENGTSYALRGRDNLGDFADSIYRESVVLKKEC